MQQNHIPPASMHLDSGGRSPGRAPGAVEPREFLGERVDLASSVCAADSVTRSRAEPAGTVGGRMATTQNPRCASCRCAASACPALPHSTGWMGVTDRPSGTPPAARGAAEARGERHDPRAAPALGLRQAQCGAGRGRHRLRQAVV